MKFRFIKDGARDGALNMAIDDYFYRRLESGGDAASVLRVYRWSPPALSLGFHQRYEIAADSDFLKERGIDVVRRPTGGKAVLHFEELTYSVTALTNQGHFAGDSLDGSYAKIAEALKRSLELLGLSPEMEKREKKLNVTSPSPCFLVPTRREILIEGKKVIGSAQKRGANAFLQHGSIPIRLDYPLLAKATRNSEEETEKYKEHFASLAEFIPSLTEEDLEKALEEGFKEVFKGEWLEMGLSAFELCEAMKIRETKYGDDLWNKKPKIFMNEMMEARNG